MISRNIINGSYAILGNVATTLFSFLSFLIIIRLFSKEEFGVWALFLTITSLVEMTRVGFVYHGVVKFCSEDKAKYSTIFTAGFILNSLVNVVLILVLLLVSGFLVYIWHAPQLIILIKYYCFFVMIYGVNKYLEHFLVSNNDFKGIFFSNTVYGATFVGSIILMNWLNMLDSLERIILLQAAAAIVNLVFLVLARGSTFIFGKINFAWIKKLFHYGKYVFGTNISSMLLQRTDILMIGFFLNPLAVAAYSIATRFSNYIEIPMKAISQIVFPKIVAKFNNGGSHNVGVIFEKSVGILLLFVMPLSLLLFIFAKPILLIVAGEEYVSSVLILRILLVYSFFKPWGRIFGLSLDAIGKPNINFYMLIIALGLNVGLNYFFIPLWGVVGAATATVITALISTIISLYYLAKISPFSLIQPFYFSWNYVKEGLRILKLKLSYD